MAVKKAKGTLLKLDIAAVFTTIAQVVSINGPGTSAGVIDVTSLTDDWMQKLAEIPDGGQLTLGLLFDPDDSTLQALTDVHAGVDQNWQIHWAGSATNKWDLTGFVAGIGPTAEVNDGLRADVTIEVTSVTFPT